MRTLLYVLALISAASTQFYPFNPQPSALITEYEWKYFDYLWDAQHQKQDYVNRGLYDYRNFTPVDVDRSNDGRTFVTIIRTDGVPVTLNTISDRRGESGPLLKPYPDWSWHSDRDCRKIISPYRLQIDDCNRLWVIDSGIIDDIYTCPAKLLAFNLYNDRLAFVHEIPDEVAQNRNGTGLLITLIVETFGRECERAKVYMADTVGDGMVIFDNGRTCRLESESFKAEMENSDYTIAGESFHLEDGIFGMALSPPAMRRGRGRFLAFRPLASKSMYGASTHELGCNHDGYEISHFSGYDVLSSQASAMAFSSDGTLFYGLTADTAIGCWNSNKPLEARFFSVAVRDPVRLQFVGGLKVIKNTSFRRREEYLLMMTNRLQKIYDGTMNFNEINFRVNRAPVRRLINGTICDNMDSSPNFFPRF